MQAPPPHYGYAPPPQAPPHAMMHAMPQQQRSDPARLFAPLSGLLSADCPVRRPTTHSLASDEWKTSLALPPKDERIRTEVRAGVSRHWAAPDGGRHW